MKTNEHTGRERQSAGERSAGGSAWWVEVLFGAVCWLTAAAYALSLTSLGPFGNVAVSYPSVVAIPFLLGTVALGLAFLATGIRRSPVADAGVTREGQSDDVAAVTGQETDV